MLLWVWIAVVVIALIILIVVGARLLRRLGPMERAVRKLRLRQEEALKLQQKSVVLQQRVADVEGKIATLSARSDRT